MSLDSEEVKLKALGKIHLDSTPVNLRQISEDDSIPYSTLIRWKRELEEAEAKGELDTLVDVDKLLVHRIAEETAQELKDLVPSEGELIDKEISEVTKAIDGYQVLNQKLQVAALGIADQISLLASACTNTKELALLASSLSVLQTAFFNKGTSINVLQQNNNYSNEGVSKFKSLQKS